MLKVVRSVFPVLERIAPFLAHRYFIKIFNTPLRYPTPEKERKAETFAKKFNIITAGKNVQCYAWGETGPYVLFIHGWAGRTTQFRRFIKPLMAAGFRVVGFDGPAHGNSEGRKTSIVEFEEALEKIFSIQGHPHAVIAHSFGGVAALFSVMQGLPIKKLVNIASPTIADEVIRTYLSAVQGSYKTGEFFKSYVLKTEGKPFEEYSSLYFVKHLPAPIDLLLVHDENDKEVDIKNAEALLAVYPNANLIRTTKLGHTRILRDDAVIRRCVTFIGDSSSL
ncbi:MAG TPA: alpha/beta hydrolase [Ohtaekwangia sp.]|nr:alpha/beta hydrolase [Ohtaekwangia sp.]